LRQIGRLRAAAILQLDAVSRSTGRGHPARTGAGENGIAGRAVPRKEFTPELCEQEERIRSTAAAKR
jgi:hypothetical protein